MAAGPAAQAEARLADEVFRLLSDKSIKAGDTRWFELQAKGAALTFLRSMIQVGAHESPAAAVAYRKSVKAWSKLNGSSDPQPDCLDATVEQLN